MVKADKSARWVAVQLTLVLGCSAAVAQAPKSPTNPDIIVKGEQDAPDTAKFTRNPRVPGEYQLEGQHDLSQAQIFTKCAKPDAATLRKIVEGPPNEANTVVAQGTFVESHFGCHLHYAGAGANSSLGPTIEGRMIGTMQLVKRGSSDHWIGSDSSSHPGVEDLARGLQGFYDRGALLEQAIATYAPDISLTSAQTHDDAVVSRFMAVEQGRNRFRDPQDLDYFKTAVCMVHAQPDLATQIAHSKAGSDQSAKLGKSLLSRARGCVPRANRIQVDPNQFRIYVVEALYRWVEAARGEDSLIPMAP